MQMRRAIDAIDARHSLHVPPHIPMGPYTVIRSRAVRQQLSTTGTNNVVLMFGAHTDNALANGTTVSNILGIVGEGTNSPGSIEQFVIDPIISGYAGTLGSSVATVALHALTVQCNCVESVTGASGQVYAGTLQSRVGRTNFVTYNALAADLIQRREMKPRSAYQALGRSFAISSYPLDMTDWTLQKPVVVPNATLSNNVTSDQLAPIVFVLPPTSTAVEYTFTVFAEWRVCFSQAALASTSIHHAPSSPDFWHTALKTMSNVAGDLESLSGMASGVGAVLGSIYNVARPTAAALGKLGL